MASNIRPIQEASVDIDEAIKEEVRQWTVTQRTNVLALLHIDLTAVSVDSLLTHPAFLTLVNDNYPPDPSKYFQFVRRHLTFNIKPWALGEERVGWIPGKQPYGHYARHKNELEMKRRMQDLTDQLKFNYSQIEENIDTLDKKFRKPAYGILDFIRNIIIFLAHQEHVQEGAFEQLFSCICKMAGLNINRGCEMGPRSLHVLGVKVSSTPNLRIYGSFMEDTGWLTTMGKAAGIPVLAVVEVKSCQQRCSDPNTNRHDNLKFIENILGTHIGQMMAELEYTENQSKIIGIAVQASKVQMVLLDMPPELKEHCLVTSTTPNQVYRGPRGTVYISQPLDFFNPEERNHLLEALWKLHHI